MNYLSWLTWVCLFVRHVLLLRNDGAARGVDQLTTTTNFLSSWWSSGEPDKDAKQTEAASVLFTQDMKARIAALGSRLECWECEQIDVNARQLDCDHSPFCYECLKKNECIGKVVCPCAQTTPLTNRTVDDLPVSIRRTKRLEWSRSIGQETSVTSAEGSFYSKTTYVKDEETDFDYVLLGSSGKLKSPHYEEVVPFALAEAPARRLVVEWLKSHWFSPSDLASELQLSNFTKAYVPFYCFNVETLTDYVGDIPRVETDQLDTPTKTSLTGVIQSLRSYYSSIPTYKTVAGKKSSRQVRILQVASASLSQGLVAQLLATNGAFTFVERSSVPDLKPFDKDAIESDATVFDVDVTDQEAWDMKQPSVSRAEMAVCTEELKQTYHAAEVKDFEAFIRYVNRDHTLVLLPIYTAVFQYGDRFFEVLCSGYRAPYIVGDRPGYGAGVVGRLPSLALSYVKNKF